MVRFSRNIKQRKQIYSCEANGLGVVSNYKIHLSTLITAGTFPRHALLFLSCGVGKVLS